MGSVRVAGSEEDVVLVLVYRSFIGDHISRAFFGAEINRHAVQRVMFLTFLAAFLVAQQSRRKFIPNIPF